VVRVALTDLQKFWDSEKEVLESAFSAGVVVASIRFVSSLICAANQKPEYNRDIRVGRYEDLRSLCRLKMEGVSRIFGGGSVVKKRLRSSLSGR
jgi:hypothetical protein